MSVELEKSIRNFICNKPITDIEFFDFNDKYFALNEDRLWIVDGGIELHFGNESFTFGWHQDHSIFTHHFGELTDICGDLEAADLDAINLPEVNQLIGKTIKEITFQWNWFSELDENFEPKEEKIYVPSEMIITLEDGYRIQLAAISYGIDFQTKSIQNPVFDSEGSFLISLNLPIDIKKEVEED
jgi:hypothetical protein